MSKAMQLKARIRNLAEQNHVPAQAVLQNYMLERVLERISLSGYKNRIVLKGDMLIASMVGIASRTTMDMDATLRGFPLTEETVWTAFTEVCAIPLDDGVDLQIEYVAPIRENDEYGGYRIAITARYDSLLTPCQRQLDLPMATIRNAHDAKGTKELVSTIARIHQSLPIR